MFIINIVYLHYLTSYFTMILNKQYVVDSNNRKIAVQLSIETFEKMEEILENYSLYNLMNEVGDDDLLNEAEAKDYYREISINNESPIQ